MMFDERRSFVNLETGEVETVSKDLLSSAEEAEDEDEELDIPEWQEGEWKLAKDIMFHQEKYERLPTKYDVHEWDIMRQFADSIENQRIAGELQDAIHGSGAFRMFKNTIRHLKIEQKWFDFRQQALEEIARDWCEEHGIPWK